MVTAICNVFINSDQKFQLFRETFPSVYSISNNWLIYIRGKYKNDTEEYIRATFPDSAKNYKIFSNLHDNNWAKSTRKMLEEAKYDLVYVYLEDHILLKDLNEFRNVIEDIRVNHIDCVNYTFFNLEIGRFNIDLLQPEYTSKHFIFELDETNYQFVKENYPKFCVYPTSALVKKSIFLNILKRENKKLFKIPFIILALMELTLFKFPKQRIAIFKLNQIINRLFSVKLLFFTPASPFNLERLIFETEKDLLPLKIGVLRQELFVNWDDDNGLSNSSAIKRGLYPKRLVSEELPLVLIRTKTYTQTKGSALRMQYYPDVARISGLPVRFIEVSQGHVVLSSDINPEDSYTLKSGDYIYIYSNIPHTLRFLEDTIYSTFVKNSREEILSASLRK